MNLESSRGITSSSNSGHCEEKFGKPLMENGDCTFLARPRYKQRKVSAKRDFPEECGPFVSKNDPVSKVDIADSDFANNTVLEDKNDEHLEGGTDRISKCEKGTQHSELKNDMFLTENLDQAIDCGLMKENFVVSSLQLDEPNLSNYEPANMPVVGMDTSDTEFARTEKSVKHDSAAGEKGTQHSELKYDMFLTENLDQAIACGLMKENFVVSSLQLDEPNLSNYEPANMPVVDMDTSDTEFARTEKSVKHDSAAGEKGTQHSELENDTFLTENLDQAIDCGLMKENFVVSSLQLDEPNLSNYEPANMPVVGMDTSDTEFARTEKSVKHDSTAGEKGTQHSELKNDMFLTENLDQAIDCGLMKENFVVSSLQLDEPNLSNYEPANMPVVGMDTSDTEFARTEKSLKHDSAAGEVPMIDGEVPMIDCSKPLSSDINVGCSGACMGQAGTKRYLPRKKVSAVREFPPLCGPRAPRLSKDYCLNGISSLNNNRADQQVLAVDDSLLKKAATTDVKENNTIDENHKRKLVDIVQADFEGNTKFPSENKRGKYIALPEESNHQISMKTKAADKEERRDAGKVEGTSRLEIIVHPEVQSLKTKPFDKSTTQCKLKGNRLAVSSDRKVVLGLMAKSEWPWSFDKSSSKSNLFGGTNEDKGTKADFFARPDKSKTVVKVLKKKKGSSPTNDRAQLVISENKDSFDPNEIDKDCQIVPKSHSLNVNVFPFGHNSLGGHENDSNVTRRKVRETLRLFQAVSRKLLHEVEAKSNERANTPKRVDLQAAKILKKEGKYVNTGDKILGSVPGVEVGDEFKFRVELNIVGLHRQIQGGIDYVKHNGKVLATAIVASGGYADDLDNSDVLTYTGQGGNVMSTDKEPEDQKLERGNLALKNSIEEQNPVRVIRGYESSEGRTYVYDGLYRVESCWQEMGPHGKLVYRFRLRRMSDQPELALKEVKKSKKFKTREGLCVDDISYGKERIPICAVNTIDDEKPPPFTYITSMMYPDGCNLAPPEGCHCTNGCSDSEKCPCVVKNGGEIPFNHDEAIVEAKPLVYECGPCCKCPSTCHNRVSQLGIKFQLEIFKTPTRGWGVRSLNSIPSGSFICEYIGEVVEDKEAEQRTGNDEYLFDIGNNYNALWDGLSTLMPDSQISSSELVKDGGFTIDALEFANVGRFINHSCSPNLYAQNVLYDHHDKRIPHIMFFAAENIPPLQELAYDYNYQIDQVYDSDGNIRKKDCFCGSSECSGRMY